MRAGGALAWLGLWLFTGGLGAAESRPAGAPPSSAQDQIQQLQERLQQIEQRQQELIQTLQKQIR
ncbi:MAG: hypothetical protein J7M29_10230, partial [Verrucomicrobia bacterium]|nr:hypothetical protein [Verrucomicrobiota bacterium]